MENQNFARGITEDLAQLAELIKLKNTIEQQISLLIGRPALIGHVGEYIAARIFDIRLEESARQKSIDGYFLSGELSGKSVNIKWYAEKEGILDITPAVLPDFYLVLAGPTFPAQSSQGTARPWLIEQVFIFESEQLFKKLSQRGMKIGVATSIPKAFWEEAEIYSQQNNNILSLSEEARRMLALFADDNN